MKLIEKICFAILMMIFTSVNIIQSVAASPRSDKQCTALWEQGDSDYMAGDWHSAQQHYELALETARRFCAEKDKILKLSIRLASSYAYQNELSAAEPIYQQLMSNPIKLGDENSGWNDEAIALLDDLAEAYVAGTDKASKENGLKHALSIKEKLAPEGDDEVIKILNRLFNLYFTNKRYADAEPVLKRIIFIIEQTGGHDLPNFLTTLAGVEALLGKYNESLHIYNRVYPIWVKTLGPNEGMTASVAREIGLMHMKSGELQQAQTWGEKAVNLRQLGHKDNTLEYARDLYVLGRICESKNNLVKAKDYYVKAIEKAQQIVGQDSIELLAPLKSLAIVLEKTNRNDEAKTCQAIIVSLEAGRGADNSVIARDAI